MGNVFGALKREIDLIDLDEKNPFVEYLKKFGELRRIL